MQMNISARKIEQPFYCHVTYRYPRVFSSFDRLACNHGVYHPYFSLTVRGEATEGTLRGLRRAMVAAEPVIGKCLQAGCAEPAARLRRTAMNIKGPRTGGLFVWPRATRGRGDALLG